MKPQNILITEENEIRLCDFGLSKIIADGVSTDYLLGGTLEYCAPEQIQFEPVSAKTDIWSLGPVFTTYIMGNNNLWPT